MPHASSGLFDSTRVILFHKQATSAMTRFLRLDGGALVMGGELPNLSQVVTGATPDDEAVLSHPASIAAEIERWLGLESGDLEVEPDYQERVEIPGKVLRIYLARFKTIDPPFAQARAVGGSFVTLTQTRGAMPVELELLRTAYAHIMEG